MSNLFLTALLITALLSLPGAPVLGQDNCLSKEVSIGANNETVKSILQRVTEKTGCNFSYSPNKVPIARQVTFPVEQRTVREVLSLLIGNSDFAFSETKDQVIIYPAPNPRKVTIYGHAVDSATGEFLIGANISIQELSIGISSNGYGFYSLSVPEGEYTVRCSYLGYRTFQKTILLKENVSLQIEMTPEQTTLGEVVITSERDVIEDQQMDVRALSVAQIRSIPTLGGEADVIKAIQLLPGVKTLGEGSSGFFVRGGDMDQNLILLDEAPVYNPAHMLGFFSAFNPDAIKGVSLYTGYIPAQFGGRLSSLLDIRMKDGNFKEWSYSGGVGLIASRFTVEGPVKKGSSSLIIAGRRTYADLLLPLVASDDVNDTQLNFFDLNAKFNARLNERNSIYFSAYSGSDVFRQVDLFNIGWGNTTATLRWNHLYNDRLFSNTSLIYSQFRYELGIQSRQPASISNLGIKDYNLKTDFSFFASSNLTVNFGLNTIAHQFNPGTRKSSALEHAAYVSVEQKVNQKLSLEYGARYSMLQNIDEAVVYHTSGGIEPRLRANIELPIGRYGIGYSRTRQYVQRLSNYTGSFSSPEIWLPSSPNIKPQIADQFTISFSRKVNDAFWFSVESYYKQMLHVVDYKDHAVLDLNPYIEGQLREGKGKAYGVEFQVQKNAGRWTGWVSYTLSKTKRRIEGINDGKYYPARYDRPHSISVVASYKANERWQLSANWIFMTGEAITVPTGSYEYAGKRVPIYSSRNASRMPDYHRLDLSATLNPSLHRQKRFVGSWTFGVYNAYFRKNAFAINYNRSVDQFGNVIEDTPISGGMQVFNTHKATTKTWLFGIVPSVTYNFKF